MPKMPHDKRWPICPVCKNEQATVDKIYGTLPGLNCRNRRNSNSLPDLQVEFTSQEIRDSRNEYFRSIVQPYRSGELSKEYLDLYGTKNINPNPTQIKKAKNVWSDIAPANYKKSK